MGVLAHLIGGIVFIIGAFVVPILLKIVPAGALFGSLAGGAMAFLILQPMNGTLNMPVVGWLSMIVLFIIYIGHVEVKASGCFDCDCDWFCDRLDQRCDGL